MWMLTLLLKFLARVPLLVLHAAGILLGWLAWLRDPETTPPESTAMEFAPESLTAPARSAGRTYSNAAAFMLLPASVG